MGPVACAGNRLSPASESSSKWRRGDAHPRPVLSALDLVNRPCAIAPKGRIGSFRRQPRTQTEQQLRMCVWAKSRAVLLKATTDRHWTGRDIEGGNPTVVEAACDEPRGRPLGWTSLGVSPSLVASGRPGILGVGDASPQRGESDIGAERGGRLVTVQRYPKLSYLRVSGAIQEVAKAAGQGVETTIARRSQGPSPSLIERRLAAASKASQLPKSRRHAARSG